MTTWRCAPAGATPMLVKYFQRRTLRKLEVARDRVVARARELGGVHQTNMHNLEAVWALQREAELLRRQIKLIKAELDCQDRRIRS